MADQPPASSSETSSQALSQFSFSLFVKLPAELQLEILSHCRPNDLVCLSLSSHYLRDLTLPLIPSRTSLLSFDQTFPTGAIECSCGDKTMMGVFQCPHSHRRGRHVYHYDTRGHFATRLFPYQTYPPSQHKCQNYSACRNYPPDHPICKRPRCKHCSCTTCPLHTRLRDWMGDRKYCPRCRKFTSRSQTKKYKGRCLHGRAPTRRTPNNRWTFRKGQSYGNRWWRGWGTCTVESWGYPEGDVHADVSRRRNARVV